MSNAYQMPTDQMGMPQRPPKSTGVKVLTCLGIVFGVLLLLCCGGAVAMYFRIKNAISTDPGTVIAHTEEITEIEIPEGLSPAVSIKGGLPFMGDAVACVVYGTNDEHSMLMLLTTPEGAPEAMQQSIKQSANQQGGEMEGVKIEETRDRETQVRGQPARFKIGKGVGEESNRPVFQVTGGFQGKTGPVMLMMVVDAEKFTAEQIDKMIDSIK